jgi:hypothetical protein
MSFFEQGFQSLIDMGVFEVFLPFLLIFAIIFGIMSKVKIFNEGDNKKFSVVIALVMGLISVFQHVMYKGSQFDVINIINNALPQVSLVLVAVIMLFLLLGIFGGKPAGKGDTVGGIVGFIAVLVIIYIFGSSAGFAWWDLPWWLSDYQTWSIVVVILVFGLIIKYITGDDKDKKDGTKYGPELGKFFFGGGDKKE